MPQWPVLRSVCWARRIFVPDLRFLAICRSVRGYWTRARVPRPGCRAGLERFDIRIPSEDGMDHDVPVILDGAHVPFNLRAVLDELAAQEDLRGPCVSVVALAADKDASGFIEVMQHHSAIFTSPGPIGRFHDPRKLHAVSA